MPQTLPTPRLARYRQRGGAALLAILFAVAPASAQVAFDTFDDGDVTDGDGDDTDGTDGDGTDGTGGDGTDGDGSDG